MSRCSGCDYVAVPGCGSGGVSDVSLNKVTDNSLDNSDPRVIVGRGLPARRSWVTVFSSPNLAVACWTRLLLQILPSIRVTVRVWRRGTRLDGAIFGSWGDDGLCFLVGKERSVWEEQ